VHTLTRHIISPEHQSLSLLQSHSLLQIIIPPQGRSAIPGEANPVERVQKGHLVFHFKMLTINILKFLSSCIQQGLTKLQCPFVTVPEIGVGKANAPLHQSLSLLQSQTAPIPEYSGQIRVYF
jgi:hypothetical protein